MKQEDKDARIIAAALQRLNEHRLPRILSLKKKVDGGEVLDEFDLEFLQRVFDSARDMNPIVDRNPDYKHIRDKAIGLCEDILEKSEANE